MDLDEYRLKAYEILKSKVPDMADSWCDLRGGAGTGATFLRNRDDLSKIVVKLRLIHEDFEPSLDCDVLGMKFKAPIFPAPLGVRIQSIREDAFKQVGSAAKDFNVLMFVGYPISRTVVREVAKEVGVPTVWIIKPLRNYSELVDEVAYAEEAGCLAVGVDVESCAGIMEKWRVLFKSQFKALSIAELKNLVATTKLPFVVKGIMSYEDAELAMDAGAKALVISNHGGTVLDHGESTVAVLRRLGRGLSGVDVMVDGGFRSGVDVLKALALGAKAVLIGRPILWGLSVEGREGVKRILQIFSEELSRAMLLTDVKSARSVPAEIISSSGEPAW